MTESTLRHLYAWHRDLIILAIASHHRASSDWEPQKRPNGEHEEQHERLNSFFLDLARATGNPEHLLAFQSLIDRFEPVQRLEAVLLDAVASETDEILAAFQAGDRRQLRNALARYHRRRMRIVPDLLDALQKP